MPGYFTSNTPPTGWIADSGVLEPDITAAGYLARAQRVYGQCTSGDCRRKCEVDCEKLVRQGLGRLGISDAKHLLRCNRLGGCGIYFSEDHKGGLLPLRLLRGLSYVRLRIACRHCRFYRVTTVEAVIAKLVEKERGDENTSFTEIAATIKDPCRQCKRKDWEVKVLWPNEHSVGFRSGQVPP